MNASLASFYFGYSVSETNILLNTLKIVMNIPDEEFPFWSAVWSSAMPIGAAFGCILLD
jgi:hypothetical protein